VRQPRGRPEASSVTAPPARQRPAALWSNARDAMSARRPPASAQAARAAAIASLGALPGSCSSPVSNAESTSAALPRSRASGTTPAVLRIAVKSPAERTATLCQCPAGQGHREAARSIQRQRTLVRRPQPLAQFCLPRRPAAGLVAALAFEVLLQDVELDLPVAGAESVVVLQHRRCKAIQLANAQRRRDTCAWPLSGWIRGASLRSARR